MTRVKICGIRNLNEAMAVSRAGAWAMGQVFAPSRRRIEADKAAAINREMGKRIVKIGVFVNEDIATVQHIIKDCCLDMVQLHGDEPPEYLPELAVPTIKSFRIAGPLDVDEVKRWRPWAYLFDTYSTSAHGGTGSSFNWDWLDEIKGREPIILAGGLNVHNIGRAIEKVRPMAVDVSSAVEFPAGGKDPFKIQAFVNRVKEADTDVSRY